MSERIFRVVVTREGSTWLADVPELAGAHTFARSLAALDRNLREVIVLVSGLSDDAMPLLKLAYEWETGDSEVDDAARLVKTLRGQSRELAQDAAERTTALVERLLATGWASRDIAMFLGISPHEVAESTRAARRAG